MHNLWQKKLKLSYDNENVIDIVQFGSSIFEETKPNDIDIAVIFQKISLKEQLIISQKIKEQLKKYVDIEIHINSLDFYALFNKANFAREGILFYGKSILTKKYFSERLGLIPFSKIDYNLTNLNKKEKIRFNYLLSGRQGKYGLLRKYNGRLVAPGIIEVNPEYENIFLEKMNKITDKIHIERIFKQIQ